MKKRGVPTHMIDSVQETTQTIKNGALKVTPRVVMKNPVASLKTLAQIIERESGAGPEEGAGAANTVVFNQIQVLIEQSRGVRFHPEIPLSSEHEPADDADDPQRRTVIRNAADVDGGPVEDQD